MVKTKRAPICGAFFVVLAYSQRYGKAGYNTVERVLALDARGSIQVVPGKSELFREARGLVAAGVGLGGHVIVHGDECLEQTDRTEQAEVRSDQGQTQDERRGDLHHEVVADDALARELPDRTSCLAVFVYERHHVDDAEYEQGREDADAD